METRSSEGYNPWCWIAVPVGEADGHDLTVGDYGVKGESESVLAVIMSYLSSQANRRILFPFISSLEIAWHKLNH